MFLLEFRLDHRDAFHAVGMKRQRLMLAFQQPLHEFHTLAHGQKIFFSLRRQFAILIALEIFEINLRQGTAGVAGTYSAG